MLSLTVLCRSFTPARFVHARHRGDAAEVALKHLKERRIARIKNTKYLASVPQDEDTRGCWKKLGFTYKKWERLLVAEGTLKEFVGFEWITGKMFVGLCHEET